jgi:hypothetical protein
MSLIDPSKLNLASVECTACNVVVYSPTDVEKYEFHRDHIHDNPMLQAWFDSRPDPRK